MIQVRNFLFLLLMLVAPGACSLLAQTTPAPSPTPAPVSTAAPTQAAATAPIIRPVRAVDADNHSILLNRHGVVTLLICTSEDSQEAARAAGRIVCPLQGRPDFQLMVVVDLRDSIATWVPSVVLGQMRSNLDEEALTLKPWYLKNGNKNNPRPSSHVIPDFSGTVCPQLGWPTSSDDLRGILFGIDGREIKRWDKIDPDMVVLQSDVRAAIQDLIDADKARAAVAAKGQGTKIIQPTTAHPPLLPPTSAEKSDN